MSNRVWKLSIIPAALLTLGVGVLPATTADAATAGVGAQTHSSQDAVHGKAAKKKKKKKCKKTTKHKKAAKRCAVRKVSAPAGSSGAANFGGGGGGGASSGGGGASTSGGGASSATPGVIAGIGSGASAGDSSPLSPSEKPGPSNTGVPAGTSLTRFNGDLVITTPGAIIDGLDVHGFVEVKAPNVTIRRSILRGAAASSNRAVLKLTDASAGNFLIEDSTLVPEFPSVYLDDVKVSQPGTFRGVDVSGGVDGIEIFNSGVTVKDSYFHDFVTYASDPNQSGGPSHSDAIQVLAGNGHRIVHNNLSGAENAAVMINQDLGSTSDLWINDNWLNGGACTLSYGNDGAYKTGMQANNNRFGRGQRNVGCAIIHRTTSSDLVPAGNVWEDNGSPVTATRG